MVTIRYFSTATGKKFESQWVDNIADFLKMKDFTRDELLDLRFFKTDILGEEIDTVDGDFLNISEGEVEIFHASNVPQGPVLPYVPYIIAALTFAAAILLRPSIGGTGNQKQGSSTNRLGSSENEPVSNGQRIDDIFGTLTKHMPPMWQAPYRIGVNNQETEVLLLCVGRGKYAINTDNVYDGYTPYVNIPNAQASFYEPGTWPGNGLPSQTIRDAVDEPIGIFRESNDLNASELLPPNDLTLGEDTVWSVNELAGVATLTLNNAGSLNIDLLEYFNVGQDLLLIDCYTSEVTSTTTLYRPVGAPGNTISTVFDNITLNSISGEYPITAVTVDTVTISGTSWGDVSGLLFVGGYDVKDEGTNNDLFIGVDGELTEHTWYQNWDGAIWSDPVVSTELNKNPDVGQVFDNIIGPITVFEGAERIIINLTSASGFYKVKGTTGTAISATVQFVVEELDINGDPTGTGISVPVTYESHPDNVRTSTYQTTYIAIPYDRSRVYGRRTSDRDKRDGVSNIDRIEWTSLYSFESNPVDMDLGDVTLMHCVVPSNSQSRLVKARKTNLDLTRKITQYFSGGTFGPVESYPTDDFAQILIHTALDNRNGRLNLSQINADGFLLLKEQIIKYFGSAEMARFGYDFDTTDMSYEDMFTTICNVVNTIPYVQNGIYDCFFERTQQSSTMQVTIRNKISDTEVREDIFYKEYDGVELSYRNEETGVSEVIYVPSDRSAINPERVDYAGCVTTIQATVRANRIRNKQIYNVASVEFDVDEFGRLIVPGQRIDSPDATRFVRHKGNTEGYSVYEGEVVEVLGLNVELSEPVAFVSGEDHYIQFTNLTGDNSELIRCVEGDSEFEIVLTSAPLEPIYDGYARDKTKYTFCSEQLRESIALIPQTIEFKMDNEQEINTISSINYDSRYYKDDLETI